MEKLTLTYDGYHLTTFQLTRLIFNITIRFCNSFAMEFSRTHDQLVQTARSAVQNIVKGS